MKIRERKQHDGVQVYAIDGGIDHTTHDEFIAEMQHIIDTTPKGELKVILDFEHLTFIGSLGLGTLLRLHHRFHAAGGQLKFARLHTNIGRVLQFSRLDRVFDLYPDIESAAASFK